MTSPNLSFARQSAAALPSRIAETAGKSTLGEFLRASIWARGLTPGQLHRVAAETSERCVATGDYVCRRDEPVDEWIGVVDGLVKLGSVSPDGKLVTFTGVTSGGWFGEGSLLKTERRRYDAVSLRDTRVASMPRATFTWLLETSIAFNRFLLAQLNERLAQMIAMIEHDRLLGPDARVAQCLAALFNPHLYPGAGRRLQISQEEIGHLSGVSRQRVNQALQVLEKAGLVRVDYREIAIINLTGLRSFCG